MFYCQAMIVIDFLFGIYLVIIAVVVLIEAATESNGNDHNDAGIAIMIFYYH